jgi:hypothetical protein
MKHLEVGTCREASLQISEILGLAERQLTLN